MSEIAESPSKPRAVRTLDLDLLRTFALVVETGGFTRAGLRIGRSQAAVSIQIQKLEDQVGQRLLQRDPRGVALTAKGEAFNLLPADA